MEGGREGRRWKKEREERQTGERWRGEGEGKEEIMEGRGREGGRING